MPPSDESISDLLGAIATVAIALLFGMGLSALENGLSSDAREIATVVAGGLGYAVVTLLVGGIAAVCVWSIAAMGSSPEPMPGFWPIWLATTIMAFVIVIVARSAA